MWVGQVSRDIGVRFTWRTWNLTTHKIDPDVDDARDYVLDYLMESGRVARSVTRPASGGRPNGHAPQSDRRPVFHRRLAGGCGLFGDADQPDVS